MFQKRAEKVVVGLLFAALVAALAVMISIWPEGQTPSPVVTVPVPTQQTVVPVPKTPPVLPSSGNGEICFHISDLNNAPVAGCKFDFLTLTKDPQPSTMRPDGCNAEGDYYFDSVQAGRWDVAIQCGNSYASVPVKVVKEVGIQVNAQASELVPEGRLCMSKFGMAVHPAETSTDMSPYLGFGSGGNCVPATPEQLAQMQVTGISGPHCNGLKDSNCVLRLKGMVAETTPAKIKATLSEGGKEVYAVTVRYHNQTTEAYVVVVNGPVN